MTATQADSGIGIHLGAELTASLGKIASTVEYWSKRRQALFESVHQIPITPGQITLTAGAGVLQQDSLLGPSTGKCWSIRRLAAIGFTQGTVTVFRNATVGGGGSGTAVTGETIIPFASAGVFTFGRSEMLLMPNDFLVIQATGITGSVTINGVADQFDQWLLPDYIL